MDNKAKEEMILKYKSPNQTMEEFVLACFISAQAKNVNAWHMEIPRKQFELLVGELKPEFTYGDGYIAIGRGNKKMLVRACANG